MDSNPRSPVGRIYANTEIAADREQRGRRSAGKWRIMPIWHRRMISAADHPLRQIDQIGRVLQAFSRGCARLDAKRSSRGRLIWRSRDLPRQETASAGNALLKCTRKGCCSIRSSRRRASRERWSSSTLGTLWLHRLVLGMAPSMAPGPQAQPGAEPLTRKLANPETCVSHFTHRGRFYLPRRRPPGSVPPPAWPKSSPSREQNCRSDRTGRSRKV